MASGRVVCCQIAEPELVEEEPDLYNCDECRLLSQMHELDGENQQAWSLYRSCCNRFTQDLGAGALLLDRLTQDLGAEEFSELTERLRLIYDIVSPRRKESS